MRLEHYDPTLLQRQIMGVISKYIDPSTYRVFIFGSRVSGKGDERSDVDVGIEGPAPLSATVLGSIREDMEGLDTLYKIDVVDFSRISPRFRQVAEEHREFINI